MQALSARGDPVRDLTLGSAGSPLTTTKAGQWIRTNGAYHLNVMIRHSGFVGTVRLEGSFGPKIGAAGPELNMDGTIGGALTVGDPDANIRTNVMVPFVRVRVTQYTSGRIDEVFVYAVPRSP